MIIRALCIFPAISQNTSPALTPSRDSLREGFHEARLFDFLSAPFNIKALPREVSWHLKSWVRKLFPQQGTAESQEAPKLRFLVSQNTTLTNWQKVNPQRRISDHNCSADQVQPPCNTLHSTVKSWAARTLLHHLTEAVKNLPKIQILNTNRRMQGWLTQRCCYFRLLAEDTSIKSWIYP